MSVAEKLPGPSKTPLLEWRARRIHDPIERLRFLRRQTARASHPRPEFKRWKRWSLKVVGGLAIWIFLLAPSPGPSTVPPRNIPAVVAHPRSEIRAVSDALPRVWMVEQKDSYEVYSNGLRIETEFTAYNRPRGSYPVFRRLAPTQAGRTEEPFDWRQEPVGIVFHSTESHQAPFEPGETKNLKRIGRNLLDFIRRERAYHFVLDRFGRVFRVVPESDIANHAGKSLWADDTGTYVNLNRSFVGIAFEAQTDSPQSLSPAQLHSARVLTEMLRAKYGIPAGNCVTHAQVSVNPSNMLIGYHTDWARSFPFGELGLPDNYSARLPSLYAFGFNYDSTLLQAAGDRPWQGIASAEEQVRQGAASSGLTVSQFRKQLQERYRRILNSAAMRAIEEENHEAS